MLRWYTVTGDLAVPHCSARRDRWDAAHDRRRRRRRCGGRGRAGAGERSRQILAALSMPPGAPNWYGEQRCGRDGDNAARGRALLTGERPLGRDRRLDRLMISALQSQLFNDWLAARIGDGLYRA